MVTYSVPSRLSQPSHPHSHSQTLHSLSLHLLAKSRERRPRQFILFCSALFVLYLLNWSIKWILDPRRWLEKVPRFESRWVEKEGGRMGGMDEKIRRLYGVGEDEGRSWLDHILKLDDEGLAPATKFTQKYLYEWQNPPLKECRKKKFLVMEMGDRHDRGHGLGSMIHMTSFPLRNALESNRILMWGDDDHLDLEPNLLRGAFGRIFVDENCQPNGVRSLDCVFEPLSHCPRSSMNEGNTVFGTVTGMEDWEKEEGLGKFGHWVLPSVFRKELERILPWNMTAPAQKYWWRGQAAAYLMRLNKPSLAHITQMRLDKSRHSAFTVEPSGEITALPFPFPLHTGTISMHIRHGDKAKEMALHSLTSYVQLGELISSFNPNSFSKMAFLSSEDPLVFKQAMKIRALKDWTTAPNKNWLWFTSSIGRINGSPFAQLDAFENRTETTLAWMAETLLAMECSAFVGTRGSNWNRVIDELRCIWIDRCKSPYLEVGKEKDWKQYSW